MFDQLVVSNRMRRKRTTAKFFIGTSALYIVAFGCALVVSVLVSDPRLADSEDIIDLVGPPPSVSGNPPPKGPPPSKSSRREARPDPNHVIDLDTLMSRRKLPPAMEIDRGPGDPNSLPYSGTPGPGVDIGVPGGERSVEPPPNPDPPKPKPAAQTTVEENRPMRFTSLVLLGKAIERRTPPYPQLARQIKLQDSVSVEVVISPEGRVESARAISGHPMFRKAAEDAARGWRFEPTLLNKVPVSVTGVITFVFKLSE